MKQNKFMQIYDIQSTYLTLQVVASGVLYICVFLTRVLPVKYFAILAAVLAVLVLLFWIIIQTGKKKKIVEGKTSKRTIISKVLSLIVSIVLVIGSTFFAARGNTFLNNVQNNNSKYAINVIVLKDGDYGTASLDEF